MLMIYKFQFSKELLMLFLAFSLPTIYSQARAPSNLVATASVGNGLLAFNPTTSVTCGAINNYQTHSDGYPKW